MGDGAEGATSAGYPERLGGPHLLEDFTWPAHVCARARLCACVRVCLPVCASLRCSEVSKPRAEVQLSFAAGQRDKNIQETRTASKMWETMGKGLRRQEVSFSGGKGSLGRKANKEASNRKGSEEQDRLEKVGWEASVGDGSPQWLGETRTIPGQERVRLQLAADREFIPDGRSCCDLLAALAPGQSGLGSGSSCGSCSSSGSGSRSCSISGSCSSSSVLLGAGGG